MRLRYLHLRDVPPLADVTVTFGHEPVMGRRVAIRFVVGVNGSGKTRFLQALTQTLLSLAQQEMPPFGVTLAYELEREGDVRTIYWRAQQDDPANNVFLVIEGNRLDENVDWERLPSLLDAPPMILQFRVSKFSADKLPGLGAMPSLLPATILAYTSGATESCFHLFTPRTALAEFLENVEADQERPLNWNLDAERRYLSAQGIADGLKNIREDDASLAPNAYNLTSTGLLVLPEDLKLAVCAVTLEQAVKEFRNIPDAAAEAAFIAELDARQAEGRGEPMNLRGILNTVAWLWPVTISLRIRLEPERLKPDEAEQLARVYECATSVLRDLADQPGRTLLFDLRQPVPSEAEDKSTGAALLAALAGENLTDPFATFRRLHEWRRKGILEDVTIMLKKRGLDDLLLYDWLSDGERMFLGRMALLHLFREQEDALILLDEPETHFNDFWKRQIVDVIDDNLRDKATEVVISTHSSIALSDVFDTEITLLKKSDVDGGIYADQPAIQTFGASPSEIMRKIFEAPDIVGQRANEFLDMVLKAAAHPALVQAVWQEFETKPEEEAKTAALALDEFKALWEMVRRIHPYENEDRLQHTLFHLWQYTRQQILPGHRVSVADAIEVLEDKLGPGYYRFEFNRRLQALRKLETDAS